MAQTSVLIAASVCWGLLLVAEGLTPSSGSYPFRGGAAPSQPREIVLDTSVSSSVSFKTRGSERTLVDRSALVKRFFPQTTLLPFNHKQFSNSDSVVPVKHNTNGVRSVVTFEDDLPIVQILNTSSDADSLAESLRRRLEMSTEFFLVPEKPTVPTQHTQSTLSSGSVPIITKASVTNSDVLPSDLTITYKQPLFRNEVWVVPILALSAVCMLLIASFEVFVLCKAWRTTPSRRHLFLGQMLLLGLFACAGLGGILALTPTVSSCGTIRFGTGIAFATVFASLLVKCVFLISLNSGVYLPAPYQGLLLLFAILIQVAIGAQWLLTNPPLVDLIQIEDYNNIPTTRHRLLVTAEDITSSQIQQISLCRTPYIDILFSLCYVLFLIVFVAILAIKSRGIRDNYREATYIGLSVGCTIPIWLVWTLSGLVVGERHRDACLAFGLVITSAVIFLVMFMPKGRQLAAMGKDGVFLEDREDRFSSLSRAGSGYSPSFFHFKPMKYGTKHQPPPATITTLGPGGGIFLRPDDGNVYTTLEPTLSSNPNVYFQRGNGMHPGMMY